MTKKIIRLLIGLLVIAIIVYAVATREGYSYDPNDGSETEAVADLIQENKRIEDDYEKSLEGNMKWKKKIQLLPMKEILLFFTLPPIQLKGLRNNLSPFCLFFYVTTVFPVPIIFKPF